MATSCLVAQFTAKSMHLEISLRILLQKSGITKCTFLPEKKFWDERIQNIQSVTHAKEAATCMDNIFRYHQSPRTQMSRVIVSSLPCIMLKTSIKYRAQLFCKRYQR